MKNSNVVVAREAEQKLYPYYGLKTKDPFGNIEVGRGITACVKNSVFHEVQNAGHLPYLDQAQECGAQALKFLSKNEMIFFKIIKLQNIV